MELIQKFVAGFIERSCKSYITTIVGLLGLALYAFNYFGLLIPAEYHGIANAAAIVIQGIALILAHDSKLSVTIPTLNRLTVFALVASIALIAHPAAFAQTTLPANVYAAGASGSPGASPAVAGTGMYAHSVTDSAGTYAFAVADILPNTVKPLTVTTNLGAGVAQRVVTIASVPIYIPTSAGVSINGTNAGWAWSTGGMAVISFKKAPNWYLMPNVRIAKSSVSNGAGYQPIIGIMVGWGQ